MATWAEHVSQCQSLKITQRVPKPVAAEAAGALPVHREGHAAPRRLAASYDPVVHSWRVGGTAVAGLSATALMATMRCTSPQRTHDDSLSQTQHRVLCGPGPGSETRQAHPVSKRIVPQPVRESPIVPKVLPEPLASLGKRFAVLRNFDPLLGRYVDEAKDAAVASAESREAADAARRKYATAPAYVREHADRGPRGVIFVADDAAAAPPAAQSS